MVFFTEQTQMGYTTEFEGALELRPALADGLVAAWNAMVKERNNTYLDGSPRSFDAKLYGRLEVRRPNAGQTKWPCAPSCWDQWTLRQDKAKQCTLIEWDGGEKFYGFIRWLQHTLDTLHAVVRPLQLSVTGLIRWQGQEKEDQGVLRVELVNTARQVYRVVAALNTAAPVLDRVQRTLRHESISQLYSLVRRPQPNEFWVEDSDRHRDGDDPYHPDCDFQLGLRAPNPKKRKLKSTSGAISLQRCCRVGPHTKDFKDTPEKDEYPAECVLAATGLAGALKDLIWLFLEEKRSCSGCAGLFFGPATGYSAHSFNRGFGDETYVVARYCSLPCVQKHKHAPDLVKYCGVKPAEEFATWRDYEYIPDNREAPPDWAGRHPLDVAAQRAKQLFPPPHFLLF